MTRNGRREEMNSSNVVITKHAMQRFEERFAQNYSDFDPNQRNYIPTKMRKILEGATENKSFLNNSCYLLNLYENYGYDRKYRFMCNEGIVFVLVKDKKEEFVVTCHPQNKYFVEHTKYTGKKKNKFKPENVISLEDAKAKGWQIGL